VSEDLQAPESGAGTASADAAALALSLSGASRGKADAFLDEQRAWMADQRHHLHEQQKQLAPRLWELRMGVLLRVATAFVGLAIAGAAIFMVWDASRSSRLLVEPFSVPPELAARGLTGEVVAGRLLARIRAFPAQTNTARAPRSFANSWSQKDLRVEIPETGVSLGQIDSYLRERLGHDTHISGEIVSGASGLTLSARADGDEAGTIAGSEADLDTLVGKLAEAIYKQTQPYLYASWLGSHGRGPEAIAIFRDLAENGPAAERPWAYLGWGLQVRDTLGWSAALALMDQAVALAPDNVPVRYEHALLLYQMGGAEKGLAAIREALALPVTGKDTIPAQMASRQGSARATMDNAKGAYLEALGEYAKYMRDPEAQRVGTTAGVAGTHLALHDLKAARAMLANPIRVNAVIGVGAMELRDIQQPMQVDLASEDWAGVVARAAQIGPVLARYPGLREMYILLVSPVLAPAQARLGRFAEAEATLRPTPADCYRCLIARAQVAEIEGQHERADWWFARAASQGPSLPHAGYAWGRVLLDRGKPDDAIAQFTLANKKGPHFADALEGWGESLMAKNQSHLALAKFAEAEKYAPNWGRLHLKWGEALYYAGKRAEAKAQFARASQLDLTPAEKAELARQSGPQRNRP